MPRALLTMLLMATLGAAMFVAPAVSSAALAAKLTVGVAEQRAGFASDPLFKRSGIRHARLLVSWNAMYTTWQRREADTWMRSARAAGVTPLVTFGHSRTNRADLPTPARYLRAFRAFRKRYPWVRDYATWNEANHCGEPTCRRPALVAAYWRAISAECEGCRVLAAELVDQPNLAAWAQDFRAVAGSEPRVWGLHNYIDANRFTTVNTSAMLAATRGELWLTETGGIVERRNASTVALPASPTHAAQATRYLFDTLVRLDPRIKRIYIYHWSDAPGPWTWDSALVASNGQARPAYAVLRDRLMRLRRAGRLMR